MRPSTLLFAACLLLPSAVARAGDGPQAGPSPGPSSAPAGSAALNPPSPSPPSNVADADALLRDGVALRRQRREMEALAKFSRAFAIAPTPRAAAQMGLAERSLQQWEPAERHLALALASTDDPWIRANRDALEQALSSVRRHLGWLIVEVDEPGLEILRAGHDALALPLREPLRVPAGSVRYSIQDVTGRALLMTEATVTAGEVTRRRHAVAPPPPREEAPVVFGAGVARSQAAARVGTTAPAGVLIMPPAPAKVEPATAPAPAPPATGDSVEAARKRVAQERAVAYGLGAIGLASLVGSAVSGILAFDAKDQLSDACVNGGSCGGAEDFDQNRRAHGYASAANVFLVVGIAATGVGTYFWLKARSDERALPKTGLVPTANGVRVTF